jgi:hypothetical protein
MQYQRGAMATMIERASQPQQRVNPDMPNVRFLGNGANVVVTRTYFPESYITLREFNPTRKVYVHADDSDKQRYLVRHLPQPIPTREFYNPRGDAGVLGGSDGMRFRILHRQSASATGYLPVASPYVAQSVNSIGVNKLAVPPTAETTGSSSASTVGSTPLISSSVLGNQRASVPVSLPALALARPSPLQGVPS